MGCKLKIYIQNLETVTTSEQDTVNAIAERSATVLEDIPQDAEYSLEEAVEAILRLPREKRIDIQNRLRLAQQMELDNKAAENFNFISNTNVFDLLERFPEFKADFENIIDADEHYNLVLCNKMNINKHSYYGKTIDSNGRVVFFMNNKFGVQKFLQYLKTKNIIKQIKARGEQLIKDDLKNDFEIIKKQYKIASDEELLLRYLDEKDTLKSFKTEDGKVISTFQVIENAINDILGKDRSNKSGLYLSLLNEISTEENKVTGRYDWKISSANLYPILELYFADKLKEAGISNSKSFKELSNDSIIKLIHELFANDVKLMQAKVSKITGGNSQTIKTEESEKNITKLSEIWDKASEGKGLKKFATEVKKNPNNVVQILQNYFDSHTDEYPNKVNVKIVSNQKNTSVKATYVKPAETKENITAKQITIEFPFTTLGNFHGYGYNQNFIWSPVRKTDSGIASQLSEDGLYHGVYIYEYYNPVSNSTEFAVSRNLISPKSTTRIYSTLQAAMDKIDKMNAEDTIYNRSLYGINQAQSSRIVYVTSKDIREGQIITALDVNIPNILPTQYFPNFMLNLFYGTVPQLHEAFKSTYAQITQIETPEEAALFLYTFYNNLKEQYQTQMKLKNFSQMGFSKLITGNTDLIDYSVKYVKEAKKKHYIVERARQTIQGNSEIYLREIAPNDIDLNFKQISKRPNIGDLYEAADYFSNKYGINITVQSKEDFDKFREAHKTISEDTRAFVYNGDIYLNGSRADMSDMFHEISHIFLRILKNKNFEAYQKFISTIISNTQNYNVRKESISKKYKGFSEEDKIEETIVSIMATTLFKKSSLLTGFNRKDFDKDFDTLLKQITDEYTEIVSGDSDNSIQFNSTIKNILTNDVTKEGIIKSMRISQFIKENMGKLIKEVNCK